MRLVGRLSPLRILEDPSSIPCRNNFIENSKYCNNRRLKAICLFSTGWCWSRECSTLTLLGKLGSSKIPQGSFEDPTQRSGKSLEATSEIVVIAYLQPPTLSTNRHQSCDQKGHGARYNDSSWSPAFRRTMLWGHSTIVHSSWVIYPPLIIIIKVREMNASIVPETFSGQNGCNGPVNVASSYSSCQPSYV